VGLALLIYVVGVAVGLALTDARLPVRVALALAWPIGPLAFVLVVSMLLVAALYIFPVFGAIVALGALASWMFFR
jgi:hypothetical protein